MHCHPGLGDERPREETQATLAPKPVDRDCEEVGGKIECPHPHRDRPEQTRRRRVLEPGPRVTLQLLEDDGASLDRRQRLGVQQRRMARRQAQTLGGFDETPHDRLIRNDPPTARRDEREEAQGKVEVVLEPGTLDGLDRGPDVGALHRGHGAAQRQREHPRLAPPLEGRVVELSDLAEDPPHPVVAPELEGKLGRAEQSTAAAALTDAHSGRPFECGDRHRGAALANSSVRGRLEIDGDLLVRTEARSRSMPDLALGLVDHQGRERGVGGGALRQVGRLRDSGSDQRVPEADHAVLDGDDLRFDRRRDDLRVGLCRGPLFEDRGRSEGLGQAVFVVKGGDEQEPLSGRRQIPHPRGEAPAQGVP